MTSPWSINPVSSVTIPTGAGPNDAAIFISGTTDLPPCMQADFVAAVFYRPYNAAEPAPTPDAPSYFTGVLTTGFPGHTDIWEGFSRYDPSDGECDFTVWHSIVGEWDTQPGQMESVQENYKTDQMDFGFIYYDEGIHVVVDGEFSANVITGGLFGSYGGDVHITTDNVNPAFIEVTENGIFLDATGDAGDIVNVIADGIITVQSDSDDIDLTAPDPTGGIYLSASDVVVIDGDNDLYMFSNGDLSVVIGGWFSVAAGLMVIGCDIDWAGSTSVSNDQAALISTAAVAYSLSATVCGVAFVAPPSGKVSLHWSANLDCTAAGFFALCTAEVRVGGTVGAGAVFLAANDVNALWQQGTDGLRYGTSKLVGGLTPGTTYNVSLWQRSNNVANTAQFVNREVYVTPEL